MKRILFCSFFAAVVLAACMPPSAKDEEMVIPPMDPNVVLQKSAEATKNLESAAYTGTVQFTRVSKQEGNMEGAATIEGTVQNTTKQVQFVIDLVLNGTDKGAEFSASAKAEIIVAGQEEVYLKLHTLHMEPKGFLSTSALDATIGTWWQLPASKGIDEQFIAVTPDPSLLQAQAEVVKIVEDKGTEIMNGIGTYHYGVEVDKEKLIAFLQKSAEDSDEDFDAAAMRESLADIEMNGELWIDAESFHTRKLVWNVVQKKEEEQFTLMFTANVDRHNEVDSISPPVDAQPFSPLLLMQGGMPTIPQIPVFSNDSTENGPNDLDPETQKILEQILEGGTNQVPAE